MKKFGIYFLLSASLVGMTLNSCDKDEFSEEDAMNLQDKLNKQEKLFDDTLATSKVRVSYTVNVVDAATNSTLKSGSSAVNAITGAVVKLVQDTAIRTVTVDASGIATFTNLKPGLASVNITLPEYSTVNYVVDLGMPDNNNYSNYEGGISGGSQSANVIPMIPIAGAQTATISGKVTFESDLTNLTPETVPAGTKVLAIVKTGGAIGTSAEVNDNIKSISYDNLSLSVTTNEFGVYSMTVPATVDGLTYDVFVSDFTADQRLLQNTYNKKDTFGVLSIPTNFGKSFTTASNLSEGNPVIVKIGAPDYKIAIGDTAKAVAVIDNSKGLDYIVDFNVGNNYEYGTYEFPVENSDKSSTAYIQLSVDGYGHASATISGKGSDFDGFDGKTIEVPYIEESAKAIVTSVNGSGAITGYKIDTDTRGIFYISENLRFVKYRSASGVGEITGDDLPSSSKINAMFNDERQFSTGTFAVADPIGSGYAVDDTLILRVTANMTDTYKGKVFLTTGEVTAVNITHEGAQYKTNMVDVVFESPAVGTKATATATVTNGKISAINITNGGSGYVTAPKIEIINKLESTQAVYSATISGGQVTGYTHKNQGNGYFIVPKITVSSAIPGAGTGASAYASVGGGKVTALNLVYTGNGYRGNTPSSGKNYSPSNNLGVKGSSNTILNIDLGTGKRTIED